MKIFEFLKKALFTNRCMLCGEVIELDDELCEQCKSPPVISGELCKSCGCAKDDCTCKKGKNEYKQIVAPFYYEDSLVKSINSFKDNDMRFIGEYLSLKMTEVVKENYNDIDFDIVTFVPLDELKLRYRGFNQSKLLAQGIAKHLSLQCDELLYKCRRTGTLHKNKSNQKRAAIVFGAYDVFEDCKELVIDKTILLVDDVKTTGSTLNECAKMLNIYGAKAVYAISASIRKGTAGSSNK